MPDTWWFLGNSLMLAGAVLAVVLAALAWQRPVPGHRFFALAMLAVAECEGLWALENLATGMEAKIRWAKLEYLGISTASLLVLLFVQEYTGQRDRQPRARMALLWVIPVLGTLLALTNEHHHLIWSAVAASTRSSSAPLIYSYGPAARVLAAFNYLLLGWTCYLLLRWARHMQLLYRRQAAVLIACIIAIIVSSLLYVVRWIGTPGLNLLPLSFTLTGVLVYLAVFRLRLLDLVPVARAMLVESMVDGVLVVDSRGRIVDSNPAAVRLLSPSGSPLAGMQVRDALGQAALQLSAIDGGPLSGFEMAAPADATLRVEVQAIPLRVAAIDRGLLLVLRDITQKWQAEVALRTQLERILELQDSLREQAIHDSLTGLLNRRFLEECLTRELAMAGRSGTSIALVVIDLDNFKEVNDQFGHAAGDRVLQAVAAVLQSGTRTGDVVCRYGGEEFVVVLPTAEAADALRRADGWRHDVEVLRVEYEGMWIGITFSAGVSAYPSCGSDMDEILRAGDRALYEAKSAGRNRVISFIREESLSAF